MHFSINIFFYIYKIYIHHKLHYFIEVFKMQIKFEYRLFELDVYVRHFCYFIQLYYYSISELYSRQFKSLMGQPTSFLQFYLNIYLAFSFPKL
jgi:hypothetical protein